jgi:hypothetical protein
MTHYIPEHRILHNHCCRNLKSTTYHVWEEAVAQTVTSVPEHCRHAGVSSLCLSTFGIVPLPVECSTLRSMRMVRIVVLQLPLELSLPSDSHQNIPNLTVYCFCSVAGCPLHGLSCSDWWLSLNVWCSSLALGQILFAKHCLRFLHCFCC